MAGAGKVKGCGVRGSWKSRQGPVFRGRSPSKSRGRETQGLWTLRRVKWQTRVAFGVFFSQLSPPFIYTQALGVSWAIGTPFTCGLSDNLLSPNFFILTIFPLEEMFTSIPQEKDQTFGQRAGSLTLI